MGLFGLGTTGWLWTVILKILSPFYIPLMYTPIIIWLYYGTGYFSLFHLQLEYITIHLRGVTNRYITFLVVSLQFGFTPGTLITSPMWNHDWGLTSYSWSLFILFLVLFSPNASYESGIIMLLYYGSTSCPSQFTDCYWPSIDSCRFSLMWIVWLFTGQCTFLVGVFVMCHK